MKINLAKSAGFCFGVKRAIEIALEAASSKKHVLMLGDIVHNEEVVRQVKEAGIRKIGRLKLTDSNALLIRAHGIDRKTFQKAVRLGYKIIDATCPMVKEIHRIAQDMEKEQRKVIVIGDRRHDEVRGIIGQLKGRAMVIEGARDIPLTTIHKIKKAGVVVQSTQNIDKVLAIVETLKDYIPDLKFFNTICRPTRLKQEEIKTMPLENDVMIVIGSKTSANTKRLYQISKSLNIRSYWLNSAQALRKDWFRDAKSVGITAGASTPDSTTKSIIEHILSLHN